MTWQEWAPEQDALDPTADQTADTTADSALLESAYGGSFAARATLNAYFEPTPWTEIFALPNSIAVAGNTNFSPVETARTAADAVSSWLNDVQTYALGDGYDTYDPTIPWAPPGDTVPPVAEDNRTEAQEVPQAQPTEEVQTPTENQASALQRELPSEEVSNAPLPEAAPVAPRNVPADSNAYHITQFTSAFNPYGPGRSNNCGPASLAMAMLAFGSIPEGVNPNNRQEIVKSARLAMTGNSDPDDLTNNSEVRAGADKVGLRAENVAGIEGIAQALDQGKLVVAGGNPIHYERALQLNGSNYGNDGKYDGGHFILVSGRQGNDFIINDPMSRNGKLIVSRELLEAYITDSKGGANNGTALWPKV